MTRQLDAGDGRDDGGETGDSAGPGDATKGGDEDGIPTDADGFERHREIVETVGDGVYEIDAEGRFRAVNDVVVEDSGYSREELLGSPAAMLLADGEERKLRAATRGLLAGDAGDGGVVTLEADVERADGTVRNVEFRICPRVEDGEFRGTAGIVRDVTDRRDREAALRESRAKIRALHDAANDIESAETVDEVAVRVVEAAEDILAFDNCVVNVEEDGFLPVTAVSSEVPGEGATTMSVEEGLAGKTYRTGETYLVDDLAEEPAARPQGPYRAALSLPIGEHGVFQAVSTETGAFDEEDLELGELLVAHAREAMTRADRERALRQERDLLERVFETSPVGIAIHDPDGAVTRVNDHVPDILGQSAGQVGSRLPSEWRFFDEDGEAVPPDERPFARAVETGEPVLDRELQLEHADGERCWVRYSAAPVTGPDGGLECVVVVGEDVTRRKERDRELQAQRDELATLNRINATIRGIDQALVAASTREAVERTVCERLADAGPYLFTVLGEVDRDGSAFVPRAWGGVDDADVEALLDAGEECPVAGELGSAAVRSRSVAVRQDADADGGDDRRSAAAHYGYRSAAAVPIVYGASVYGVLGVYSGRRRAFDEREQAVLQELGETIGHAINAVESKKLLHADSVLELEFRGDRPSSFFPATAAALDCRFDAERVVPTGGDAVLCYERVTGAEPSAVVDRAVEDPAVADARVLDAGDGEGLLEFRVTGPSPVKTFADRGARVRTALRDPEERRYVVELAPDADVREFVEGVETLFPALQLASKREVERPVRTLEAARRESLDARLTDRQRAVLEAAFYAGYYDWPRGSTAEEVADSLGVASPTFLQHLRKAQGRLLDALLPDGPDVGAGRP